MKELFAEVGYVIKDIWEEFTSPDTDYVDKLFMFLGSIFLLLITAFFVFILVLALHVAPLVVLIVGVIAGFVFGIPALFHVWSKKND